MSRIRYAGFAEESVYGTKKDAQFHVDIASASLDLPNDSKIEYEGGLSRTRRTVRSGYYTPSGDVVYAFDIETIGALLKWALGGYFFTNSGGSGTHHLHEIWGNNNFILPSFTTEIGKDLFEHIFTGCTVNSLTLSVEDGYGTVTLNIQAKDDEQGSIKVIGDLIIGNAYPIVFHEVTVSRVGDAPYTARVKTLNLVINNNISADAGRRLGSNTPVLMPVGKRETDLSMNLYYDSIEEINRFKANSEFPLNITFNGGTFGTMVINLPKCANNEVSTQATGIDEIDHSVTVHPYADSILLDDGTTTIDTEIYVKVENNITEIDTIPATPKVISASTNGAGTEISIEFNVDMEDPTGKYGEFVYQINNAAPQPFDSAALGSADTVIVLTCDGDAISAGDMVTVTYTRGTVVSDDGGILQSFAKQPVNNIMV